MVPGVNARHGAVVHAFAVVPPGKQAASEASLIDTNGDIGHGYDVHGDALVLVRPDGYVGLVTHDHSAEHVHDYLVAISTPQNSLPDIPEACRPNQH